MKAKELACHDNRKSFYGKARVTEKERIIGTEYILTSYGTDVCRIIENKTGNSCFIRMWDGYSDTTMRHINSFRFEHCMPTLSKKEWESMELFKEYY